jgi:hypothetical protein
MARIDEALAELKSLKPGECPSYKEVAAKFKVSRTTLSRRYRGVQGSVQAQRINNQKLSPQQEQELVEYINRLTKQGLQPTRTMVQNFATQVAKDHVGNGWVTRFLQRNQDHLTSRWTMGMDAVRHKADSESKYKLYFELLTNKITQYDVLPKDIYNMDEKGFMIGVIGRSKRIFSKARWDSKEVRASLQDGSREWVTLLAAICVDGSHLSPGIIFESKRSTIQSGWVDAIKVTEHDVFVTSSPSGWTNNDIGLAWLKQVFNRQTKKKAGRRWRLLIVDGHGSHVTMDFLEYCNKNKILVAIYPPHSTHTLQPLDVVMFKPLSSAYKHELTQHLHLSQGLIAVKKGDFFPLFWRAWVKSFTQELVLKSFQATGVVPLDPEVILKRFHLKTPEEATTPQSSPILAEIDWRKMRSIVEDAVKDGAEKIGRKITLSLHHMQMQNQLLEDENKGLRHALSTKKKHKKKSNTLDLQQREEYHGGAVFFWSPSKIREARYRERVRAHEEEQEKLQKAERRHMREQATLLKKIEQEEAKVEREKKREEAKIERQRKAEERAELQRKIQQEREAATAQKALQLSQKGKRAASQSIQPKAKRRRGAQPAEGGAGGEDPAPSHPPKTNSRCRKINLPKKFK